MFRLSSGCCAACSFPGPAVQYVVGSIGHPHNLGLGFRVFGTHRRVRGFGLRGFIASASGLARLRLHGGFRGFGFSMGLVFRRLRITAGVS